MIYNINKGDIVEIFDRTGCQIDVGIVNYLGKFGFHFINWDNVERAYPYEGTNFWKVVNRSNIVQTVQKSASNEKSIDKHYAFNYNLTPEDIQKGQLKIDPYFVSQQWKLGEKDNSGALWHCFKTIARFGIKNPIEREIKALHLQVKRLAELNGVNLNE